MLPAMPVETAQTATTTTDSITGQLKRKADHVFVHQNGHKDRYTAPQMLKAGPRAGSSADNAIPLDSSDDETDHRGVAGSASLVKAVRLSASITSAARFNAVPVRGVPTSNQRPSEEGLALKPAGTSRPGDTTTATTTAKGDASCPSTCRSNGSRDTAPLTPAPAPTPTSAAVTPPKCLQTPESEHQHRVSAGTEATPVQKGDTHAQGGTAPSTPASTPPPTQAPSTGSARPQSSTTGDSPGTSMKASSPNARKPCSLTGPTGPSGCVTATSTAKTDNATSSGAKAEAILHERQRPYPSKTKRRPGRPAGSKNRITVKDPPYIAASSQQQRDLLVPTKGGAERFGIEIHSHVLESPSPGPPPLSAMLGAVGDAQESVPCLPNVSTRPKRQPGPRMRWADEMMNPGEQWLRKGPKEQPALLPNPVDSAIPDAPTFYPNIDEFRDPLSYIETIRPVAEMYGIAKIVPPDGWKPPDTPMKEHINKLIPTKKQALHCLMNSDEVYDEGREFTLFEYKSMAENFSKAWLKRDPPAKLKRRLPRCMMKTEPQASQFGGLGLQHVAGTGVLGAVRAATPVKSELQAAHHGCATSPAIPAGSGSTPVAVKSEAASSLPQVSVPSNSETNVTKGEPTVETSATAPPQSTSSAAYPPWRVRQLEEEYWNAVDGGAEEVEVEYANDLDISEFWSGFPLPPSNYMDGSSFDRSRACDLDDPEYYRTCGWNLNNLPFWPGSVLRFFRTHINGLTAPWLYLGMQFATFAWHNEDNYLYSLNYHHSGAPKQWYGVPGKHAKGFELCLARVLGETLDTVSEHLYRITKMLSPVYLQREKVPVCRLLQEAGEFVVTFPKAYHGGFSYGFNCGEAVNFAVPDWISYSRESTEAYRQAARTAALSHDKMVATLTMYLPDYDVRGCELVLRELKRIQAEELDGRRSLEEQGALDPSKQGLELPKFGLGLIDQDTEDYDERRVCKTCKHRLFMTGVACRCNDLDVSCLRCVKAACGCGMEEKYLLSWWTEEDLSRFVHTAETFLRKLRAGRADTAAIETFKANINPFT